jgi:hypothetical protein
MLVLCLINRDLLGGVGGVRGKVVSICFFWTFMWLEGRRGRKGKGRYLATGIKQRITNKILIKYYVNNFFFKKHYISIY